MLCLDVTWQPFRGRIHLWSYTFSSELCVLCDHHVHNLSVSRCSKFHTGLFWQNVTPPPNNVCPPSCWFGFLQLLASSKAKSHHRKHRTVFLLWNFCENWERYGDNYIECLKGIIWRGLRHCCTRKVSFLLILNG